MTSRPTCRRNPRNMSISLPLVRRINRAQVQPAATLRRLGSAQKTKRKRDVTMKFMMIVKSAERSGLPPKELMEAIDKLSEEANKAGSMIGGAGLGPTALGARVRLSNGKVTVTDGPFAEAKEIIGGYAQVEFKSKQKSAESAG